MDEEHEQITDSIPAKLFNRVKEFLASSAELIEEDPDGDQKVIFEVVRMSIQDERERILEYMMDYRGWLHAKRKQYKRTTKEYQSISGAIILLDNSVKFIEKGAVINGGMFDERAVF